MLIQEGRFPGPPLGLPACRSAVLPRGAPRHPLHQVHPGVLEFLPDHPEAEKENPEVVLGAFRIIRALVFGARAGRGFGLGGDGKARSRFWPWRRWQGRAGCGP